MEVIGKNWTEKLPKKFKNLLYLGPNGFWPFLFFKSLTEGGIGGRVKEKVKPDSKKGWS